MADSLKMNNKNIINSNIPIFIENISGIMISSSNDKDINFLFKSKNTLDKLSNKISQIAKKNNKPGIVLQTITSKADKIRTDIDTKIQDNFNNILNSQTLMPIQQQRDSNKMEREDGTKALMEQYWKAKQNVQYRKSKRKLIGKQNIFPPLKQNQTANQDYLKPKKTAVMSSLNVKIYQREKQRQNMRKNKQQKLMAYLYTYMVHIIDFKVQNDSTEFLLFQKNHYAKWDQIDQILKAVQHFCEHYTIRYCTLDLQKVMQLIESSKKNVALSSKQQGGKQKVKERLVTKQSSYSLQKQKNVMKSYTPHQLLGCLQNAEEISSQNSNKRGIRFYGFKGKIRAIIKIQASIRSKLAFNRCKKIKELIKKVMKIQKFYRIRIKYRKTKEQICKTALQKYQWFTKKQKQFKGQYRLNQLTKKLKYQIHISSHSLTEWQRFSTEKYEQKHNSEITRIFRAVKQGPNQTRVIYITPCAVPQQVLNYYNKLLQLGGAKDFKKKITVMSPTNYYQNLQKFPLTRLLYYDTKLLRKIKSIINGSYAYIVPSVPSIDYVSLCKYLDMPLYSCSPQALLHLQTQSGTKEVIKKLSLEDANFSKIPYAINIYTFQSLLNQLAKLIYNHCHVNKWILKIDGECQSRGLACIDINKFLPKKLVKHIRNQNEAKSDQIYSQIYQSLKYTLTEYQKLVITNLEVYRSQTQYLSHFYVSGGIIQASLNNFENTETNTFCINLQPDNQFTLVSQYKKIKAKNKSIGCYYDNCFTASLQESQKIQKIVKQLMNRQLYGYFIIDFIKVQENNRYNKYRQYINYSKEEQDCVEMCQYQLSGIKCYLDDYSSAGFVREFLSKESNVLYVPMINHENIKKISMQTFFHLCRLQNISFDIQRKMGNIFMFLDGLESGCLGLMTFNQKSKVQTFIHAAQVLDFFSSKLSESSAGANSTFLLIRNAINGYLNQIRKKAQVPGYANNSKKSISNIRTGHDL